MKQTVTGLMRKGGADSAVSTYRIGFSQPSIHDNTSRTSGSKYGVSQDPDREGGVLGRKTEFLLDQSFDPHG
jgi:hypothetical protein